MQKIATASFGAWIALLLVGIAWGGTQVLSKLVVEGGHHAIGISFLATAVGAAILAGYIVLTRQALPLGRRYLLFYAIAGALGTALPNALSYEAMRHLSVGVVSIVLALVPIMTLLLALVLRMERPDPVRLAGLGLGAVAVLVLVVPEASLPAPDQAIWVALPVLSCLCYALENVYIAKSRPENLAPLQVMCGLFWAALIMLLPTVWISDTWMIPGAFDGSEFALVAMTLGHIGAYSGFVWLIGRAGPVFAAQVAYVVTLTGVFMGMAIFGEAHSAWVWLSLVMMMAGLTLVRPRER
ncbi:MAG: DMT family transporter [Pseudomonadota bacterium]